jgi:DNA repair exonuclease SbcCD ATPase subunit
MTERLKWKSKANIPHHDLRGTYDWIDDFLKIEDCHKQIEEKNSALEELKRLPRALADVKKTVKASKERVAEQQKESLKAFIINYSRHPDPVEQLRFELPDSLLRLNLNFPDELIDAVFTELKGYWSPDAVSDTTRKQRKKKLQDEIAELESVIAQFPDFEKWSEFVNYWRSLNSKVSNGVDPQGFSIKERLRPGDAAAFEKLGMVKYLNPNSEVLPAKSK